jgi:hypothetical protein
VYGTVAREYKTVVHVSKLLAVMVDGNNLPRLVESG